MFENCAPFTDCTNEINNTQVDNAKDFYVAMPVYNLIKYSNNFFQNRLEVYGNIIDMSQMINRF